MSHTQISELPVRSEPNAILVPSGENWGPASTRVEAINFVAERLGCVAVGTSICQILMFCDRCSYASRFPRREIAGFAALSPPTVNRSGVAARRRDSPETATRFGSAAAAGRKHQLAPVGSPGEAFTKRNLLVSHTRRLPAGNRDEVDTTRGADPVEGHRATVGRDGGSTVTNRSHRRRRELPLFQTLHGHQEDAEGGLRSGFQKAPAVFRLETNSVPPPTRAPGSTTRFCARDHRARESRRCPPPSSEERTNAMWRPSDDQTGFWSAAGWVVKRRGTPAPTTLI